MLVCHYAVARCLGCVPTWFVTGCLLAGVVTAGYAAPGAPVDLILRGGSVLDGTGAPPARADVAVQAGRIQGVGQLDAMTARREIDVTGLIVAPGFIDLHSHADAGLGSSDPRRRAAPNLVSQGITTVVVNQDGGQQGTIAQQKSFYQSHGIGPNALLMVGHNAIRRQALGSDFRRAANAAQLERMRQAVRQGMREGAYGISAGLEYVPGIWSTTDELVALVREIVPGGVAIVHERASGVDPMWYLPSRGAAVPGNGLDTIRELIEIADRTGATVVATHIKARGAGFWGASHAMIEMIDAARSRGLRLYADQYPYNTTGSDGRLVLVPEWLREAPGRVAAPGVPRDFAAELAAALDDAATRADVERDVAHEIERRGGALGIVIMDYPDKAVQGKTLAAAAAAADITPVEMALRLQLKGDRRLPGGGVLRGYSLAESDVEAFASQSWTATSTDAGVALPGDGDVHARFYGSFPRKIRRYALERGALSVAAAVRSATALPAEILKLYDRGQVRAGCWADLVVFDLEKIRDKATFDDPHQYSEGIDYVFVAGRAVVDAGRRTDALPGAVLSPPGEKPLEPAGD